RCIKQPSRCCRCWQVYEGKIANILWHCIEYIQNELTLKCCDNSGNYKRTCTVKVDSEHIKRSGTHFSTSRLRLFKIDPAFNSLIVVFEVCWRAPHSNSRLSPPAS
ncbi:Hypothetical predicted protein, partial [Paramuricea clavata]